MLIRRNITPKGSIKIGNADKYADMGNLDPDNFLLTFWDQKVEIPVLIKSVEELLAIVQKKLERLFHI